MEPTDSIFDSRMFPRFDSKRENPDPQGPTSYIPHRQYKGYFL